MVVVMLVMLVSPPSFRDRLGAGTHLGLTAARRCCRVAFAILLVVARRSEAAFAAFVETRLERVVREGGDGESSGRVGAAIVMWVVLVQSAVLPPGDVVGGCSVVPFSSCGGK